MRTNFDIYVFIIIKTKVFSPSDIGDSPSDIGFSPSDTGDYPSDIGFSPSDTGELSRF